MSMEPQCCKKRPYIGGLRLRNLHMLTVKEDGVGEFEHVGTQGVMHQVLDVV